MAIDRGEITTGRNYLDEGTSAAQGLSDGELLGTAWALALDLAVHTANPNDARQALEGYGQECVHADRDHWPAALGRWLWLAGDINAALQAVQSSRDGYESYFIRAEQCRLLLVSGRHDEAIISAKSLIRESESMNDIQLFARMVLATSNKVSDREFEKISAQTHRSRWIHLYLGGMHMNAIRKRLRGEDASDVLKQLHAQSQAIGHQLYTALSH